MKGGQGIHGQFAWKSVGKYEVTADNILTINPFPRPSPLNKILILFDLKWAVQDILYMKFQNAALGHNYINHYCGFNGGAVHTQANGVNVAAGSLSLGAGMALQGSIFINHNAGHSMIMYNSDVAEATDGTHMVINQGMGWYISATFTRLDFVTGGNNFTGRFEILESINHF